MTCKDCYNYELCVAHEREMSAMLLKGGYKDISNDMADGCRFFTNKERDVVPVVRCENCKHFITDTFKRTMCNRTFTMFEMQPEDYCSYGEGRCED